MKYKLIILILLSNLVLINTANAQLSDNIILGEIIDVEGEYVFINIEKNKDVIAGMIFGIYDLKNEAIAVCEINKIAKKGNYIAHILTQTDEIKKGYTALADIEREYKLRERIKEIKADSYYLDSFKKFNVFIKKPPTTLKSDIPLLKDSLLRRVFCESMHYIGIDISKFSKTYMTEKEEEETIPLNTYRDIIDESSALTIDNLNNKIFMEASVNIGKLKRRLKNIGYSFKPKIIRLVFPSENNNQTIRLTLDKIIKTSNYIAKETEDINDITSPVSCVIYTTPKIFANELNSMDFEDIGITPKAVYEDTIELSVW